MRKSESIVEISKALAKFQEEVEQPLKDADNPFFRSKYVPLESVVESISKTAPKHGLSFVQWALNDEQGRVGVATMLMHESGEYIEFDPVFMNAEKNTPQGAGSLITYLKRYSLSAVFGITSDQDDDGNESSGNNSQKKPQQKTSKQPTQKQQDIQTKIAKLMQQTGKNKGDTIQLLGYNNKQFTDLYNGSDKKQQELITKLEDALNDYANAG